MMELVVDIFLWFLVAYLSIGVLFSIYFITKGAGLIDDGIDQTPWHFKAIIIPGSILLWIVLLLKIMKRSHD